MVGSLKVIYLLTARDFEHCSPNRPSTPGTKIGSTGCPPIRLWRCKRKKSKVLPPSPVPLLTLTAGNGKFHCAIAQAMAWYFPAGLRIGNGLQKACVLTSVRRCVVNRAQFVLPPLVESWRGAKTVSPWAWLRGFLSRWNPPVFIW